MMMSIKLMLTVKMDFKGNEDIRLIHMIQDERLRRL
jgi:hypothetical protein